MARKPSKKTLKNKLDKLVSEIVRKRGECQLCNKSRRVQLQCCHIFSRKYLNTRWDLDNVLCMCAGCHFRSHAEPILFAEWVKKRLGEDKYNLLKEAHNIIYKPTLEDLQTKLKCLEELRTLK